MSAAERIARLLAETLPAPVRERYREEWLADLAGAGDLGVRRGAILRGAFATALTIDRSDPALTGVPRERTALGRTRTAAGLVIASGVLITTVSIGADATAPAAAVMNAASLLLLVLAVPWALGAVAAAARARRPGLVALALLWALPAMLLLAPALSTPVLVIPTAAACLVLAVFLVVPFAPPDGPVGPPPSSARRAAVAVPSAIVVLAVAALGALHTAVWNPLAKVPGWTLEEIYAEMAVQGEASGLGLVLGGLLLSVLAVAGYLVLAFLPHPGLRRAMRTRRLLVLGLALVAAAVFGSWIAGFRTGMGVADTAFDGRPLSGGDVAIAGFLLSAAGRAAFAAALVLAVIPSRRRTA